MASSLAVPRHPGVGLVRKESTLSHQTGKRVLTASTTLALAAVGLAVSPITANAASLSAAKYVNGCGTQDEIQLPLLANAPATDIVSYAINGSGATPLTIKSTDASSETDAARHVDINTIPGFYVKQADGTYAVNSTLTFFHADQTAATAPTGATTMTPAACVISIGGADAAGVSAPITKPVLEAGAKTITITGVEGVDWVVKDGDTTKTYSPAKGATAVHTMVSTTATVTPVVKNANYVLSPTNLAWTYLNDGKTNIAAPDAPKLNDAATAITYQTPANVVWKVTDTSVTTVAGAANGTTVTGGTLSTKDYVGKTVRFWALPADGYSFLPDGSLYKMFDVTVPAQTVLDVPLTSVVFTDATGKASDTFMVPVVEGATFYYADSTVGTDALKADGTLNTGWTKAAEGTAISAAAFTGKSIKVMAYRDSTSYVFKTSSTDAKYTDITATGPISFTSAAFTDKQVVTPAAPTYVDGSGLADTFTTPAANPALSYTITVKPTGGTSKALTGWKPSTTYTRADLVTLGLLDADKAKDLQFVVAAAPVDSANYALPMDYVQGAEPWTKTVYAGTEMMAPKPVFTDNSGATTEDVITLTETSGITYTYKVAASGTDPATMVADQTVTYKDGKAEIKVAAGSVVKVKAQASAGYVLTNADADDATKRVATFVNGFTAGSIANPVAPTQVNLPGTDKDTYTINGTTGVDYFVNGEKFDAAKFNLPQSTGGAKILVVTAKAQEGYAFPDGATTSWTLDYSGKDMAKPTVTNVLLPNTTDSDAQFSWGAEGAVSYTVTYQKQAPGAQGAELPWLKDTTTTSARFVAMAGDTYRIFVVAKDAAGNVSEKVFSDVTFPVSTGPDTTGWMDLNNTTATYVGSWTDLRNVPQDYFNKSAMLGYNGAATITLPAGQKHFELYGTIWSNGGAGTLQVNGQNWADFNTRGVVAQPYQQMLRRLNLPDTKAPITIRIIPRNAGGQYLALDAFKYTAQ